NSVQGADLLTIVLLAGNFYFWAWLWELERRPSFPCSYPNGEVIRCGEVDFTPTFETPSRERPGRPEESPPAGSRPHLLRYFGELLESAVIGLRPCKTQRS